MFGKQADEPHQLIDALAVRGAIARFAVHLERLADDIAHAHARVQRAVRVLVDHLHAPPDRPHAILVVAGDVRALEHDAPGSRLQHAQDREPGGGLAASALADKAKRLAVPQREADLIDGLHGAGGTPQQNAAREREVHA